MTFEEVSNKVTEYIMTTDNVLEQRRGQLYFNALYNIDPELGDSIRGTEADPYHDDSKIPAFVDKIREKYS